MASISLGSGVGIAGLLLLSLRMMAIFLMTPVFYALQIPRVVQVLLIFCLAGVLALGMRQTSVSLPQDVGGLIAAAVAELALGATFGLGILVAFGAFALGGHLLDIQIGFGLAHVFDPVSRRQIPVLNAAFNQLGVLVFLLMDGHHALLRGIAASLEIFPLGSAWQIAAASASVLAQMSEVFVLGFSLVAPVVTCVLLVELTLGVIARNLPQMNTFVIALPIKIAVALLALLLWSYGLGGVMQRIYLSITREWEHLLSPASMLPMLRADF